MPDLRAALPVTRVLFRTCTSSNQRLRCTQFFPHFRLVSIGVRQPKLYDAPQQSNVEAVQKYTASGVAGTHWEPTRLERLTSFVSVG